MEFNVNSVGIFNDKWALLTAGDKGGIGSKSGRDGDKIKEAGLTPKFIENSVTFEEAETILVCRKIYSQELDIDSMPENVRKTFYSSEAAHTMFIGEVTEIKEK